MPYKLIQKINLIMSIDTLQGSLQVHVWQPFWSLRKPLLEQESWHFNKGQLVTNKLKKFSARRFIKNVSYKSL